MLVTFNPDIQGRELSTEELEHLRNLKPDFTDFSDDEPELTTELLQRMKKYGCGGKRGLSALKSQSLL